MITVRAYVASQGHKIRSPTPVIKLNSSLDNGTNQLFGRLNMVSGIVAAISDFFEDIWAIFESTSSN